MAVKRPVKKSVPAAPAPEKSIFGVADTNFMKGVALCFLLWHHLFFISPGAGTITIWNGVHLAYFTAVVMKVCVAMFLLLSGYGLFESAKKYDGLPLLQFWKKSYVKIYLNYWLVWAVFVSIGVFFFPGGSLEAAYGDKPVLSTAIVNFLGLQNVFRLPSYNQAWWFISVIFVMYLIFPAMRRIMLRLGRASIIAPAAFFGAQFTTAWTGQAAWINIPFITNWAFPFVFGMWLSQNNAFAAEKDRTQALDSDGKALKFLFWIFIIGLATYQRQYGAGPVKSFYIDGLFAAIIIHFLYQYFTDIRGLKQAMWFLGKHSFNIFLFHNILYETYFPKFFYNLGSPFAGWAALMSISVAISIVFEKLKERFGFYKLQSAILGK